MKIVMLSVANYLFSSSNNCVLNYTSVSGVELNWTTSGGAKYYPEFEDMQRQCTHYYIFFWDTAYCPLTSHSAAMHPWREYSRTVILSLNGVHMRRGRFFVCFCSYAHVKTRESLVQEGKYLALKFGRTSW